MAHKGLGLENLHQPVLVPEVLDHLVTVQEGVYVDGTCGLGGHSASIGRRLLGTGRLICLDRDPQAVALSKKRLGFLKDRVKVIRANYADMERVLKDLGIHKVHGVLLDLGMSSYQIEKSGRGFSFNRDEPLDMRMDPDGNLTARHLVNTLPSRELERLLRDYGEEKRAKSIARAIVRAREKRPIETSLQLAKVTKSVFPRPNRNKARHPATRTFQALRIAVNSELQHIEMLLSAIPMLMVEGGRLVMITYHSLEDRLVKMTMAGWEKGCRCPPDLPKCACGNSPVFKRITKKGLKPTPKEVEKNPRGRSATLRAAERI